jgi:hypothetical protein
MHGSFVSRSALRALPKFQFIRATVNNGMRMADDLSLFTVASRATALNAGDRQRGRMTSRVDDESSAALEEICSAF